MLISYIADPETMRAKWLAFFFILGCFCVVMTVLGNFLDEHKRLRDIRRAANEEQRFTNKEQPL